MTPALRLSAALTAVILAAPAVAQVTTDPGDPTPVRIDPNDPRLIGDEGPFPARPADLDDDDLIGDEDVEGLTLEPAEYDLNADDGTGRWEARVGFWGFFATGDYESDEFDRSFDSATDYNLSLDNELDPAGFLQVTYLKDRLRFDAELTYLTTGGEAAAGDTLENAFDVAAGVDLGDLTVDTTIQHTFLDLLGGYQVFEGPALGSERLSVHALGGVRLNYLSIETHVQSIPDGLPDFEDGQEEFFADLMLGVAKRYMISERFAIDSRALVGGFDLTDGSDYQYDLRAAVEYRPVPELGLYAGYRFMGIDYDQDEIAYDAFYHGPYVAAGIAF